jgi:hypothetical protein
MLLPLLGGVIIVIGERGIALSTLFILCSAKIKDEQDQQRFNDLAALLYKQSVLSRSDQLENPICFVNRLNALLMQI